MNESVVRTMKQRRPQLSSPRPYTMRDESYDRALEKKLRELYDAAMAYLQQVVADEKAQGRRWRVSHQVQTAEGSKMVDDLLLLNESTVERLEPPIYLGKVIPGQYDLFIGAGDMLIVHCEWNDLYRDHPHVAQYLERRFHVLPFRYAQVS